MRAREYTRAVTVFSAALDMRPDPKNAAALYEARALANSKLRNYRAQLADLERASAVRPRDASLLNEIAWLRATGPDPTVREGKTAIRDAKRACELTNWKDADLVDTLAAAHAEAGDFGHAAQMQERAIASAPFFERQEMRGRLELFRGKRPFRDHEN